MCQFSDLPWAIKHQHIQLFVGPFPICDQASTCPGDREIAACLHGPASGFSCQEGRTIMCPT